MKTKIVTGVIASFMLLSGPVFAQTGDIGNTDTGKNSENTVDVKTENEVRIDVDNDANICNQVSVNANTGGNTIGDNVMVPVIGVVSQPENKHHEEENVSVQGNATIETGNANASATITNEVNTTEVSVAKAVEEEEKEEEEGGRGAGGETITEGGLGGGNEVAVAEGGLGAGVSEGGLGGGSLPEAGFEGFLPPLILSSVVTFFMTLKRKKMFNL